MSPRILLFYGAFFSFMFATSFVSLGQTEDLDYSSGSQGEDGALVFPEPLSLLVEYSAIAYDAERDQVVVFGGYDRNWQLSGDMWVWSRVEGWTQIFPETAPPARECAVMCYDAARKEVVLFGGWGQNGELNDTWVWNGEDWTQKTPGNPPPTNGYYHSNAMVYDVGRKEVILLHYGSNISMYAWNGSDWIAKSTSNNPTNGYYDPPNLAYDPKSDHVIFLNRSGTWTYNGTDWKLIPTATQPETNWDHYYHYDNQQIAYDPVSEKIIYFGSGNLSGGNGSYSYASQKANQTWCFNGSEWKRLFPPREPHGRYGHAVVGIKDGVLLIGGYFNNYWEFPFNNTYHQGSTEIWDGSNWIYQSGGIFEFDMSEKPNGVWKFSRITIPKGLIVRFKKNLANTPVHWLSSGDVRIDGILDVSGEHSLDYHNHNGYPYNSGSSFANAGKGGPGGFDGGRGGVRFSETGSYAGSPGIGPGGGLPGVDDSDPNGQPGQFIRGGNSTFQIPPSYGNVYLQPLIGGSGGGGSASLNSEDGIEGGGGGGAILIASSQDIIVSGAILANGGSGGWNYNRSSGPGSGGAIRLVADRVTGNGTLSAQPGAGNSMDSSRGRIRIEAFERDLANSQQNVPVPFQAPPIQGSPIKNLGSLRVVSVAGKNVNLLPGGDLDSPDVEFDSTGEVEITVAATGVPDNTPVRVRVTMRGGELQSEPRLVNAGQAVFSLTIPAGVGTVQAYTLRSN